eukprot:TRINITY_DN1496_c0_g1_i1.p1 TRINITY_DN1496_c0_g1~~TRINITY_DN1496_c0_g1_i1.p1  ORF type:complete len:132 (-),score=1.82 TRINITY_DN1496_c0_g1_i1:341-736(-)
MIGKWRPASQQLIGKDATGPYVDCAPVHSLWTRFRNCLLQQLDDLWREVLESAQPAFGALFLLVDGEAEVAHLERPVTREVQVLRLDVAVDDAALVQVVKNVQQRTNHLSSTRTSTSRWICLLLVGDNRSF